MRRACVLLMLLAGGAVSMVGAVQNAPLSLRQIVDNLYVLNGGCMCGNTTFFVTDAGVAMVDTKVAGKGPEILEQLRTVTDQPIAMIINTHTHFDHTGANTEFGDVEQIVSHANAKASLMKSTCETVTNCDAFKGENAKYLPNVTFEDKKSLQLGSEQIDLYYFGPGHTDGDAWIVLPSLRIAFGGDMFGAKGVPFIDSNNGGTAWEFGDTIAKAAAGLKDVDQVISGHVDIYPFEDLVRYAEFHKHLKAYALEGMKAGKPSQEVADAYRSPEHLSDFTSIEFFTRSFVQGIYDGASAQ